MPMPNLRPCPFCGGRAFVTFEEKQDPPFRYLVYLAKCAECGARTKDMPTGNFYGQNYTPEDAANAWKERLNNEKS